MYNIFFMVCLLGYGSELARPYSVAQLNPRRKGLTSHFQTLFLSINTFQNRSKLVILAGNLMHPPTLQSSYSLNKSVISINLFQEYGIKILDWK